MSACAHETIAENFCTTCSAFCPTHGQPVIRESYFHRLSEVSPSDLIGAMIQDSGSHFSANVEEDPKRNGIVNWVCELSETFKLNLRTMHTAVSLLDKVLAT